MSKQVTLADLRSDIDKLSQLLRTQWIKRGEMYLADVVFLNQPTAESILYFINEAPQWGFELSAQHIQLANAIRLYEVAERDGMEAAMLWKLSQD